MCQRRAGFDHNPRGNGLIPKTLDGTQNADLDQT